MEVCLGKDFISFGPILGSRLMVIVFGGLFLKTYSLILIETIGKQLRSELILLQYGDGGCGFVWSLRMNHNLQFWSFIHASLYTFFLCSHLQGIPGCEAVLCVFLVVGREASG